MHLDDWVIHAAGCQVLNAALQCRLPFAHCAGTVGHLMAYGALCCSSQPFHLFTAAKVWTANRADAIYCIGQ